MVLAFDPPIALQAVDDFLHILRPVFVRHQDGVSSFHHNQVADAHAGYQPALGKCQRVAAFVQPDVALRHVAVAILG